MEVSSKGNGVNDVFLSDRIRDNATSIQDLAFQIRESRKDEEAFTDQKFLVGVSPSPSIRRFGHWNVFDGELQVHELAGWALLQFRGAPIPAMRRAGSSILTSEKALITM